MGWVVIFIILIPIALAIGGTAALVVAAGIVLGSVIGLIHTTHTHKVVHAYRSHHSRRHGKR